MCPTQKDRARKPRVSFSTLFALSLVAGLIFIGTESAHGQASHGRVIYTFTGGEDGGNPQAGLVEDTRGNLYGTTAGDTDCASSGRCGTVFELAPSGDEWVFTTLYRFQGGNDGAHPAARLAIGSDGSLYGTTVFGGGIGEVGECQYQNGCGTVFKLTSSTDGTWTETIIYHFLQQQALNFPYGQGVVVDWAGNLYGTTALGGAHGAGTVYELSPTNHGWVYKLLHSFDGFDGTNPWSGVILDPDGDLYGTTPYGTVYELIPSNVWTERILFQSDGYNGGGYNLYAAPTLGPDGSVYGAFANGGILQGYHGYASGLVFRLDDNQDWLYSIIHHWNVYYGVGPTDSLLIDDNGNIYGTNHEGDHDSGAASVFMLTPGTNGSWRYVDLYYMNAHPSGVIFDTTRGGLYGTTQDGGEYYQGTVFEVTP